MEGRWSPLLFVFSGKGVASYAARRWHFGMAVKEVEVKRARKSGVAKGSGPEKDLTRPVISMEELVLKAVEEQLAEIIHSILWNISVEKHLPSAKCLIDLATLIRAGREVPAMVFEAFAERLKKDFAEPAEGCSEEGQNE